MISVFESQNKVLGHANGEFVPNAKYYFDRIGTDEMLTDAPVFDYFHLQSFGDKKDWEWRLQDVHGFIGEYPTHCVWYISDKCKKLFEQYRIATPYHFYETRLLYKGKKLVYWIFQFPIKPLQSLDFANSEFYYEEDNTIKAQILHSEKEFLDIRSNLALERDIDLKCSKPCLVDKFDLVYNLPCSNMLVSDRLRKAIEDAKIEGFEFSEVDYKISISSEIL